MKRILAFVLFLILIFSFAACANININPQITGQSEDVTAVPDITDTPEPSQIPPTDAPETDTHEVHFLFEEKTGKNATEYGILKCCDESNEVIWEYETDHVYSTELDNLQDIGLISTGYLLQAGGDIICVGVDGDSAGKEVWRNSDFCGGSANFDFDQDDNLYICGYYGPDLMVIDCMGNTVSRYASICTDAYWPDELMYVDGHVNITYASNSRIWRCDPESGASMEIGPNFRYYSNAVKVATVDEFIDAIDDNTTIILAPGEYNISEWLDKNILRMQAVTYDSIPEEGLYYEDVGDGFQLDICGYCDLTFISEYTANPARIVCEPRHADVISLMGCSCVTFMNLVLGHTPDEGYCSGDVVEINSSEIISFYDCELYGCGAYAITASNCPYAYIDGCNIHDCTYGCAVAYNSCLEFFDTKFSFCKEYSLFEAYSSDMYFWSCSFNDMNGQMAYIDANSYMSFNYCLFDADAYQSLIDSPWYGGSLIVY